MRTPKAGTTRRHESRLATNDKPAASDVMARNIVVVPDRRGVPARSDQVATSRFSLRRLRDGSERRLNRPLLPS